MFCGADAAFLQCFRDCCQGGSTCVSDGMYDGQHRGSKFAGVIQNLQRNIPGIAELGAGGTRQIDLSGDRNINRTVWRQTW